MPRRRTRDPQTGHLTAQFPCEMYAPGHNVHWIQALRSHDSPAERGWVESVEGTLITIEFPYRTAHFRNHDPERFIEIVGHGPVTFQRGWLLLRWAGYCFSIAAPESWEACRDDPLLSATPDDLAERLRTHGGFSVPASALQGWLTADDEGPEGG